jgi:hypothetical protein
VANPEDEVRIAASDDAIAIAIDLAFLKLVGCKRPYVLLQTCLIKAVVIVNEMSVEGVNFLILLIFGSFRSCSSCLLAALGGRDDGVFGSRLSNARFECGGLGRARQGLEDVRDGWRWRRRRRWRLRWLLGVNINGLAGSAARALVRARRASFCALFRVFVSRFRRHSDGDHKAEITTLRT